MVTKLTLGPPRYYCPVCVRRECGFIGGPSAYREVPEKDKNRGPIIVEGKNVKCESHSTQTQ